MKSDLSTLGKCIEYNNSLTMDFKIAVFHSWLRKLTCTLPKWGNGYS